MDAMGIELPIDPLAQVFLPHVPAPVLRRIHTGLNNESIYLDPILGVFLHKLAALCHKDADLVIINQILDCRAVPTRNREDRIVQFLLILRVLRMVVRIQCVHDLRLQARVGHTIQPFAHLNGQGLSQLLQLYGLPYEMIGVYRDACGTYRFTDSPFPMPEYVSDLPNKIHILDNEKMNAIGDDRYALSMHWFERERNKLLEGDKDNQIEPLRRHLGYFFNKMSDAQSTDRMWGVFAADEDTVKGPGYTKKFVQWNERSKNCYMNRRALAYCPNIFMNVGHKDYFRRLGIPVDEDAYALSIMIQWIWRSAIRCGEDIDIYVPSSRMRKLLTDWIKSVSGGDALAS